jgi:hypothetical protein
MMARGLINRYYEQGDVAMTIMVDEQRITKDFYDKLTPFEQGYATYFQAEWPNAEIPKECPYPQGSPEAIQFANGEQAAVVAVTDVC